MPPQKERRYRQNGISKGQQSCLPLTKREIDQSPDQASDARKRSEHEQQRAPEAPLVGGSGISRRDRTYEALSELLDKRLDGFGELFRMLSYEQVGSAAMLSRALGGIARGKPLFSLPGSPAAVQLALEKLILPELGHLLGELEK